MNFLTFFAQVASSVPDTGNIISEPSIFRALIVATLGFSGIYILAAIAKRVLKNRSSEHFALMMNKIIVVLGSVLVLITVLTELGFNLTAVLGAAGIVAVAVGFAAQTSLSNIISGVFLYWEKPFQVGDLIKVGDTTGVVLSIDLMSVKLRQLDNLFVRLPNETMIKTQVTNVTRFPIRRFDLNIGVAYGEDVAEVIRVLKEVADENPYCLDEPEPVVIFRQFGESSLDFMLGMWFEKTNFLQLRNSVMQEVKEKFDAQGIEIPFPHLSLYVGSKTQPFPIKIIGDHEQ